MEKESISITCLNIKAFKFWLWNYERGTGNGQSHLLFLLPSIIPTPTLRCFGPPIQNYLMPLPKEGCHRNQTWIAAYTGPDNSQRVFFEVPLQESL